MPLPTGFAGGMLGGAAVNIIIRATDQFSGAMKNAKTSLEKFGKAAKITAVGIGGDPIVGSDFVDILELFEHDDETKAVVLFGEVGGVYEERVAEYVKLGKITKPIVAIIAGGFTQDLPLGTVLGHAGTIVMKGRGSYDSKIKALTDAGVAIAETVEEIPALLKKVLQ